ncbi:MAG: hypothetical protein K6C33_00710, partial [Desulfovibrio sp.]|nr:hypothetical protein [Desulfovibrio sp.]
MGVRVSPSAPNFEEGLLTYGNPSFFLEISQEIGHNDPLFDPVEVWGQEGGQETIGTASGAQAKRPATNLLLEKLCTDGTRPRKSRNRLLKELSRINLMIWPQNIVPFFVRTHICNMQVVFFLVSDFSAGFICVFVN